MDKIRTKAIQNWLKMDKIRSNAIQNWLKMDKIRSNAIWFDFLIHTSSKSIPVCLFHKAIESFPKMKKNKQMGLRRKQQI
jgi:hypothetical protein